MGGTYKVYLVTHRVSGKCYVGITCGKYVSNRWGNHLHRARSGCNTYFYRAIRKHGSDAFGIQTIGEVKSRTEASMLERLWILLLRSNNREFGYNTTVGGEAPKHTDETRAKISAIQKGARSREYYRTMGLRLSSEQRSSIMKKLWASGQFTRRKRDWHPSRAQIAASHAARWGNRNG